MAPKAKLIGFDVDELMMNKAKIHIKTRELESGITMIDRIEFIR
ncbi:MAG: hypothetical protein WCJ45_05660 [bacterium]